jgi:hypothetical protein
MEKKGQDTLVYLLGGVGLIVLLGGAFGLYNLVYGLIAAFFLWIVGGAIGKAILGIVGSIGFILVLVRLLHFQWTYVLLGTIAIWVIFGALKRYS